MSAPSEAKPLTTEDLLALPDDGVDRELVRGERFRVAVKDLFE